MWWAEEVQQVALKGKPMHLVNNTAAINKKIEEWNLAHGWPRFPEPTTGATEGSEGSSGESDSDGATGGQGGEGGCACNAGGELGGAALLGGLGLLGLRRRRR
ncbi:MAG TPA: MYXO-CTERM sorting domain-containing protein, partial [Nannocystis sp.]